MARVGSALRKEEIEVASLEDQAQSWMGVSWECVGFMALNSFIGTAAVTPADPSHKTKQTKHNKPLPGISLIRGLNWQERVCMYGSHAISHGFSRLPQDEPSPSLSAAEVPLLCQFETGKLPAALHPS